VDLPELNYAVDAHAFPSMQALWDMLDADNASPALHRVTVRKLMDVSGWFEQMWVGGASVDEPAPERKPKVTSFGQPQRPSLPTAETVIPTESSVTSPGPAPTRKNPKITPILTPKSAPVVQPAPLSTDPAVKPGESFVRKLETTQTSIPNIASVVQPSTTAAADDPAVSTTEDQSMPMELQPEPEREITMIYMPSYFADKSERKWTPASYGLVNWVMHRKDFSQQMNRDIMHNFWSDMLRITRLNPTDEWYKFYDEIERESQWPHFKKMQFRNITEVTGHRIVIVRPPFKNKHMPDWVEQLIYNVSVQTLNISGLHILTSIEALQELFAAAPGIQDTPSGKVYQAMVEVGRRYHILNHHLKGIADRQNLANQPDITDVKLDGGLRPTDQHILHFAYPMPTYYSHPVLFYRYQDFIQYVFDFAILITEDTFSKGGAAHFTEKALQQRIDLANIMLIMHMDLRWQYHALRTIVSTVKISTHGSGTQRVGGWGGWIRSLRYAPTISPLPCRHPWRRSR
jgi:hypothetical protein